MSGRYSLVSPLLALGGRRYTGCVFDAEARRRGEKKRRSRKGEGVVGSAGQAAETAEERRSPSCARIGKLKHAPPKQSELRSDGQGGALSQNWRAGRPC